MNSTCKIKCKYSFYSGKSTYDVYSSRGICRVDPVNLSAFTSKLQVTHVNCVWGLVACSPQVNLRAFAGNFARASFTMYYFLLNRGSWCWICRRSCRCRYWWTCWTSWRWCWRCPRWSSRCYWRWHWCEKTYGEDNGEKFLIFQKLWLKRKPINTWG